MKTNFIDNYPSDHDTQIELLNELENYLDNLTPEKVFLPRFTFLLQYFKLNGDDSLKEVCHNWLDKIHNVVSIKKEG